MPIGNKKPRGLLRLVFRLPVWLYRLDLGWILGERFLLLTHVGRRSGATHQTVIEVMGHEPSSDTRFVIAAFGSTTDWLLNIGQNSSVTIRVKGHDLVVRARTLSEPEGARVLLDYADRHSIAFRFITSLLIGESVEPTEENCRQFVKSRPVVAFEPQNK